MGQNKGISTVLGLKRYQVPMHQYVGPRVLANNRGTVIGQRDENPCKGDIARQKT